ncbi:Bax inhibitor-1/YccA family protein [Candidatus Sneabacter namystus]|uniref:Bax inhibitor-1/YccA family protein n=1 Tax=Candidatus Sneabacter namystus TaxID=2601646 RepID=A0A5C0UGX3_9RICK|nr:Bax inhibitor-1/YccA family protein [Candidatus Sneabacter namystus]QEK39376.1 Bax inhibitor-1/YccA family protein [Candidatus Sneabacter namystus]
MSYKQGYSSIEIDSGLRTYMLSVYKYMCSALFTSAVAAFLTANVSFIRDMMFITNPYGMLGMTKLGILVSLSPMGIALYFFLKQETMRLDTARNMFWAYSILTGMSLASVCFAFTGESVVVTFLVCASLFGLMSLYGHVTKKDLTAFGSFLLMGLWGLVIASVISLILPNNSTLNFVTSVLGVAIFTGIVAYDTQRIKSYYYSSSHSSEDLHKVAIIGAFVLYLDVLNMFLYLLRFFGVSSRNSD